jgi:hypothetical protein
MNSAFLRNTSVMVFLQLSNLVALPALASESTMASGTLSVEGPNEPLAVTLAHAYYVTGPNRFGETRTVRSVVFTADDQRAAIDACADLSCTRLSSRDGLKIDLDESGMVNWWAHIATVQYSSTETGDALTLSVDSADRVAGTFKLSGSGATTSIEFDASLVRDFSKKE